MTDKFKMCPCCNNYSPLRLVKLGVEYFQCSNCCTLFSEPLDNENMIGGEAEVERNTMQNNLRIGRVNQLTGGQREGVKILDFGCGNGMLVDDLKKEGYQCDGYDAYNPVFQKFPERDTYHICTMIECIEHLSSPFFELNAIYRSLVVGGAFMVETSFVDIAAQEKIELENFFYIAPQNGHSTIFSHHGLDVLMVTKGFEIGKHFNRHVRLFYKK